MPLYVGLIQAIAKDGNEQIMLIHGLARDETKFAADMKRRTRKAFPGCQLFRPEVREVLPAAIRRAMAEINGELACRVCGCTERDCTECVDATGDACHWVDGEDDLCSRCADEIADAKRGSRA
jgi:hypothetical protein